MVEAGWLIFVIWIALFGLGLSNRDKLLKVMAGFVGILFSFALLGDTAQILNWAGAGLLLFNFGLIIVSIFD